MGLRVERVVLAVLASVLAVLGHIRPEIAQLFFDYMHIHVGMYAKSSVGCALCSGQRSPVTSLSECSYLPSPTSPCWLCLCCRVGHAARVGRVGPGRVSVIVSC